jgi:hypothetical protein
MTTRVRFGRARLAPLLVCALAPAACSGSGSTPGAPGNDATIPADTGGAPSGLIVDASTPDDAAPSDGGCGGTTLTASARDASILLVLDKSGSMTQRPNGFSTTKWDAMHAALAAALGQAQSRISIGLELFPAQDVSVGCVGNCCSLPAGDAAIVVDVGPGTTTVPSILARIATTAAGGGTPTADALGRALGYFTTGAGKNAKGDKYVLLATDGGPNCNAGLACAPATCTPNVDGTCSIANCCDPASGGSTIDCLDDASVVKQLDALRAAGVKTFVVGIPGSEAYAPYLDTFAQHGGTPNPNAPPSYYAVSASGDVAGLTSTFEAITGQLITSCRLQLQSQPQDPSQLNVTVDGVTVHQGGADGWTLDTSTTPPTVVLEGTTCTALQTQGARSIQIVYGCPTVQ